MGRIIGIDLGTCRSVTATIDGPRPRILQNREAKNQTPSAVSLRKKKGKSSSGESEILYGDAAIDNMVMAPKDTIISVKRLMGRAYSDPDVQKVKEEYAYEVKEPSDGTKDSVVVTMGEQEYTPIDISAMILKKLKEDAEFRLGEEVSHAVVTVPAYFSQIQRDATRKAAMKAGLKIIKIQDEPTAAAIAFGLEESGDDTDAKITLVYDLGGGTFDISVLMWSGGTFVPLNKEGDMWLGGDNFDQVIMDHVINYIKQEFDIDPRKNVRFMANLKLKAREIKERLSSSDAADFIIPAALQDNDGDFIDLDLEITRSEFERKAGHLVDRSVMLVNKAMENAALSAEEVHYVVMAGNSTCIPMVQRAMEKKFGQNKVLRKTHPKECVALGAAIIAARLNGIFCEAPDPENPEKQCGTLNSLDAVTCSKCGSPFEMSEKDREEIKKQREEEFGSDDIAPFSYGTQSSGDQYNVFIKKNDSFPTQDIKVLIFHTQSPGQRIISIPVYGGDNLIKASANEKQGEAFAILPPDMPEGTEIRIRLWLDEDGIFDLSAHLENGTDLKPIILKGGHIQRVVQQLEELIEKLAETKATNPQKAGEVEHAIEDILDDIKGIEDDSSESNMDDFDNRCQDIKKKLETDTGQQDEELRKAENIVNYAQYISQRYAWAIEDVTLSYQLREATSNAANAIQQKDISEIELCIKKLLQVLEKLPQVIGILIWLSNEITTKIKPMASAKADELLTELDLIEQAFKSKDPSANFKLQQFINKIQTEVGQVGGVPSTSGQITCHSCGRQVPAGKRFCPHSDCGADLWVLGT